jgi:predicted DNA-binding transcriptional regulator AlpA
MARADVLPISCPPRGLSRVQAAAYVGVGVTLFDEMVDDGRLPKPFTANSRKLWDRLKLDAAIDALSDSAERDNDPWAKVAV